MIPLLYLLALLVTLALILNKIIAIYYPAKNKKWNKTKYAIIYFFVTFLWIECILDWANIFFSLSIGVLFGLLVVFCYCYLDKTNIDTTLSEENVLNLSDYIGLTGQVYQNIEGDRYLGIITNSTARIEITCLEHLEKYDAFKIVNFENGEFIGEKININ